MIDRVFLAHPRAIDEGYFEHQRHAFGFAVALFMAACACALHGIAPALCEKTGSRMVGKLYARMVSHRSKPVAETASPWADYAI